VHCWTPSCGPCRAMEKTVFADPNVTHSLSQHYVPVKLNLQDAPEFGRQYGIRTIPTDVVIRPDGTLIDRTNSPRTPESYVARFQSVALAAAATPGTNPAGQTPGTVTQLAGQQPAPNPMAAQPGQPPQAAGQTPSANLVGDRYKDHPLVNNQFADRYGNEAQPAPPVVPPTQSNPLLDRAAPDYRQGEQANLGQQATAPIATMPQPGVPGQPASQQLGGAPVERQQPQPGINPYGVQPPAATVQPQQNAGMTAPQNQQVPATQSHPSGLQLPPGVPPLAFDGYCVVSVRDDEIWRMGNPAWGVIHRGQTYLFHSQKAQEAYGLVLNGHDVVHYAETGQLIPGSREFGATHKSGGVFLFANEANLQRFQNEPATFISRLQAVQAAAAAGPQQR
jgi:YHS domain-containing protein